MPNINPDSREKLTVMYFYIAITAEGNYVRFSSQGEIKMHKQVEIELAGSKCKSMGDAGKDKIKAKVLPQVREWMNGLDNWNDAQGNRVKAFEVHDTKMRNAALEIAKQLVLNPFYQIGEYDQKWADARNQAAAEKNESVNPEQKKVPVVITKKVDNRNTIANIMQAKGIKL